MNNKTTVYAIEDVLVCVPQDDSSKSDDTRD